MRWLTVGCFFVAVAVACLCLLLTTAVSQTVYLNATDFPESTSVGSAYFFLLFRPFYTTGGVVPPAGTTLSCSFVFLISSNACNQPNISVPISNCSTDGTSIFGSIRDVAGAWSTAAPSTCIYNITNFMINVTSPSVLSFPLSPSLGSGKRLITQFPSVSQTSTINIEKNSSVPLTIYGSNFPVSLSESPAPTVALRSSGCTTAADMPCIITSTTTNTITCSANLTFLTGDTSTGCRLTALVSRIGLNGGGFGSINYVSIAPAFILSPAPASFDTLVISDFYLNLSIPATSTWSSALTYNIMARNRSSLNCPSKPTSQFVTYISPGYVKISVFGVDGCILLMNITRGVANAPTIQLGTYLFRSPISITSPTPSFGGPVIPVTSPNLVIYTTGGVPSNFSEFIDFKIEFVRDTNLTGPAVCPPTITDGSPCSLSGQNIICNIPGLNVSADGCRATANFTRLQYSPLTMSYSPFAGYIIGASLVVGNQYVYDAGTDNPYFEVEGTYLPRGGDYELASFEFTSTGLYAGQSCSYSFLGCYNPVYNTSGTKVRCGLRAPLPPDGCVLSTLIARAGRSFGNGVTAVRILRYKPVGVATPDIIYAAYDRNYNVTLANITMTPLSVDGQYVSYSVALGAPCSGTASTSCSSSLQTFPSVGVFNCLITGALNSYFDGCPIILKSISRYSQSGIAGDVQIGTIYIPPYFQDTPNRILYFPQGGNLAIPLDAGYPRAGDNFTVTFSYLSTCAGAAVAPQCPNPILNGTHITCPFPTDSVTECTVYMAVVRNTLRYEARVGKTFKSPLITASQNLYAIAASNTTLVISGTGFPLFTESWNLQVNLTGCATEANVPLNCTSPAIVTPGSQISCRLDLTAVSDTTCSVQAQITRWSAQSPVVVIGSVVTSLPPVAVPVAPPVAPPVAAPVRPPVAPPVAAPVRPPIAPPVATPTKPPVAAPVASPILPPLAAPTTVPSMAPALAPSNSPAVAHASTPSMPPNESPAMQPVDLSPTVEAPIGGGVAPTLPPSEITPPSTPSGAGTVPSSQQIPSGGSQVGSPVESSPIQQSISGANALCASSLLAISVLLLSILV